MSNEASLSFTEKLQPLILISAVFLGVFFGKVFPRFGNYSDPILFIAIIMLVYSVVLGVPHGKIWSSFKNWRFFGIACFVNFVIIPLLAWGLAIVFLSAYPYHSDDGFHTVDGFCTWLCRRHR